MLSRFHPVYHSYTHLAGARVDIERVLEASLDDMDAEDVVDAFSEPPHFYERLSPVSTVVADAAVKGRNWTDMMIQCYRSFGKIFTRLAAVLRQSLEKNKNEAAMVPFLSITVDPDTLVRLIERDYEAGETSYSKLIELFENGVVTPSVTTPFHPVLPLLPGDFDKRLCIRCGLLFYRPILKAYERYLKSIKENQMTVAFWFPEACVDPSVVDILDAEFRDFCEKEKFQKPHLVLLLDADLAPDVPLDHLMKHWVQIPAPSAPEHKISVVFRDPAFSEWMMTSHPSIKKIIDRTIAKVDRGLDEKQVDYAWAHFESLEALTYSPRDAVHLEQRILKMCEMGYLALSPDTFIRRKRNGRFTSGKDEPLLVKLDYPSAQTDPPDGRFGVWRGWGMKADGRPGMAPPRPYVRQQPRKTEKCPGSSSWKIAWTLTRDACFKQIAGHPEKMAGGMLGLLSKLTGQNATAAARNVENFLVEYGFIYWREHFIQHNMSEGDIRLDEIVARTLRKGTRKALAPRELAAAACAAQAYYFLLDSCNSYALQAHNFDQRALFQNALMLTLAFCRAIAAFRYAGAKAAADKLAETLRSELADFKNAWARHRLENFGVSETEWKQAIASETPDSDDNVVERAARRTAARHLAPFGYEDLFPEEDEEITTNCGHHWAAEVNIPNYRWANPHFCGVREA